MSCLRLTRIFGLLVVACAPNGTEQNEATTFAGLSGNYIAVDSANIYTTAAKGVLTCATSGCGGPPMTLAQDLLPPGPIVTDGTNVYWTDTSSVLTCVIANCDMTVLATDSGGPGSMAVDASHIYWVDGFQTQVGSVMMAARTGVNLNLAVLATAQHSPFGISVDSTSVYWTTMGDPPTANGTVMKCAIDASGSATALASGQNAAFGIALDAANVYWTNRGSSDKDGTVAKCSTTGCDNPTVLATGQSSPAAIAVDGTNVYWVNSGRSSSAPNSQCSNGSVMTCPTAGCKGSPTILYAVSDGSCPSTIAIDANNVYWASGAAPLGASVMKLPKPKTST